MGPTQPESQPVARVVARLESALGERLEAVYRYGGTAGFHADLARADSQRLLVLVDAIGLDLLEVVAPVALEARDAGCHLRVTTARELESGADAHPVFLLQLLDTGELLTGADVRSSLSFEPRDLRLRLEQALRNVLWELTDTFLAASDDPPRLSNALRRHGRRSLYLVKGLLVLGPLKDSVGKHVAPGELLALTAGMLSGDERDALRELWRFAESDATLERAPLHELYGQALGVLTSLIRHADAHEATASS